MTEAILKLFRLQKTDSTAFSRFFREASSREKKKVFLKVAKLASEEQRQLMK